MAEVKFNQDGTVTLTMSQRDAGILKDLLHSHVAGMATTGDYSLSRIRKALVNVSRVMLRRSREYGNNGYAVVEEYHDEYREQEAKRYLIQDIGWDAVEGHDS